MLSLAEEVSTRCTEQKGSEGGQQFKQIQLVLTRPASQPKTDMVTTSNHIWGAAISRGQPRVTDSVYVRWTSRDNI